MTQRKTDDMPGNNGLPFFREFLKHPLQIGSIIPSSRFLEQRILDAAGVASARTVVELGPGTGGTTRAILRVLPPQASLLSIEINPYFHRLLGAIRDRRLIAHLGNANALKEILAQYGLGAPEAIISGIPFSTMNNDDGARLIETISNLLAPNGRFVAYQVSNRVATLCRPVMGAEQVAVELRNIPPMRVYRWEKRPL
jgi:phospholipid N-methyltransferase